LTRAEFKTLVRQQFFMLLIDQDAALDAIPALLPDNAEERRKTLDILREVVTAPGDLTPEVKARLEQMAALFEAGPGAAGFPASEASRKSNRPRAS
jgi:hypothetical protein